MELYCGKNLKGKINMTDLLNDFKELKTGLSELKEFYGDDLHNISNIKSKVIYSEDVISAIKKYIDGIITLQDLIDWVNTVWFTDLYKYNVKEEDSIASVMTLLETIDEEDVKFSKEEYLQMIASLKNNTECEL
jgi:hypothetical protein